MPTMAEVRAKFPQYNDMSDEQLAGALHKKFYADMPEEEFKAKIGLEATINPNTMQPGGVPEFVPPGVEGYDPKTGLVTKGLDAKGTFAAAMPEGVPIAGPLLDKAAMSASAGIGSLISGDPYSKVRAEMDAIKAAGNEAHPYARMGGNVAGAAATLGPLGGTEAGGYALGVRGANMGGRVLRSALSGSGISAADTAARGGDQADIIQSGLIGGGIGGAVPVLGSAISKGASKLFGTFNKAPKNVTQEALVKLEANKDAAYALSEKAGVMIKPQGMKHLADKVEAELTDFGYDPDLHPGAKVVLRKIEEKQGQNVTLKGLDTIRKTAGNAYVMGNKSNNAAVSKIVSHIDDLIKSNDPNLMAGLDTKVGTKALNIARQFAHRAFKLEKTMNLVKKGNQNADRNITDTRVKSVKEQLAKINDPFSGWGRGFNDAEKKAAEKAAKYTGAERALHGASVLNPIGGGKLSAGAHLLTAGANIASGNLPGLVLQGAGALAGVGFQKAAHNLAAKSVNEFVDIVARGGVPAPVVKNAMQLLSEAKRSEVQRLLMSTGIALNQ